MKRIVLGVLAGYALWTAIWLGGGQVFFSAQEERFKAGEAVTDAGPLAGFLALSVVCSLAGGLLTATIAKEMAARAVLIMAGFLLLTGIAFQAPVWSQLPVWYHLSFLALLVPVTVVGGKLAGSRPAP